jgi:hypothetical protein
MEVSGFADEVINLRDDRLTAAAHPARYNIISNYVYAALWTSPESVDIQLSIIVEGEDYGRDTKKVHKGFQDRNRPAV